MPLENTLAAVRTGVVTKGHRQPTSTLACLDEKTSPAPAQTRLSLRFLMRWLANQQSWHHLPPAKSTSRSITLCAARHLRQGTTVEANQTICVLQLQFCRRTKASHMCRLFLLRLDFCWATTLKAGLSSWTVPLLAESNMLKLVVSKSGDLSRGLSEVMHRTAQRFVRAQRTHQGVRCLGQKSLTLRASLKRWKSHPLS